MGTLGCIFAAPNRGSPHFNAFNPSPQKVSFPVPGNRARTRDPSKFHFSSTPHTPGSFIFALSLPPVSFIFRHSLHPRKVSFPRFPSHPPWVPTQPHEVSFFLRTRLFERDSPGSRGGEGIRWSPGPTLGHTRPGPRARRWPVSRLQGSVDFPGGLTRECRDGPGPGAEMG